MDKEQRLWAVKNNGIKGFSGLVACLDLRKRKEYEVSIEEQINKMATNYGSGKISDCRTLVKGHQSELVLKESEGFYYRDSEGSKKGSEVSTNTKTSFNRRIKHDVSVFCKDELKDIIIVMYDSYLVKICMKIMSIFSIQELGLKKRVDKIFEGFYKQLVDSAYCPLTDMLILAFKAPMPSMGHSTKSFADPNGCNGDSTARLCFFNIKEKTFENNPVFLKEITIGGKNRSKIEYLNSFGSMSVDPSNQYLLVSGNQTLGKEESTVQILSLYSSNFLDVLASQNFSDNIFTENNYWLTDSNFILANGFGSLIIARIEKSSVFGLKVLERELDQKLINKDGN